MNPSKPKALPDLSSSPRKRFRAPTRCKMGSIYYDEHRGLHWFGRAVPRLRLGGRWLEQCGFSVGDDLQVTVGQATLLISRRGNDS